MKEILAENRFVLTRTLFFEGTGRVWKESSGKSIRRLLLILALVWGAFTVYTLSQGGGIALPAAELVVLALVVLWTAVWLPRSKARRGWHALSERGTADAERVTRFYADRLEVEADGRLTEIDYSDVIQTLTSKNLLILITMDKTGILLERSSFTRGTEDEVLQLIKKEKEPHD